MLRNGEATLRHCGRPRAFATRGAFALAFALALGACSGPAGGGADGGPGDGGRGDGRIGDARVSPDLGVGCALCHGSALNAAPPVPVSGSSSSTSQRGVGAHQEHLAPSTWRAAMRCDDCHKVPKETGDPRHVDSPLPAEVTFSALAQSKQARPEWNGVTCSNTYCHGGTMSGGTLTAPSWTTVDGTASQCGACHGMPPTQNHPSSTNCHMCHSAVVDEKNQIAAPHLHLNGKVETVATGCCSCHGTASGTAAGGCADPLVDPAPPKSVGGGTAASERGVGAHAKHLGPNDWHVKVQCEDCHRVPTALEDPGHVDSPLPAELVFSPLATVEGKDPTWDGTSCANTYCHGGKTSGGKATSPIWTKVDGSQGKCDSCHGMPPGGTHPQSASCSSCHAKVVDAKNKIIAPNLHLNGTVETVTPACTTCHGVKDQSEAPPVGTTGQTATSDRAVGAHAQHLSTSTWHRQVECLDCHLVPKTEKAPGHVDSPLPAEVIFSALVRTGGSNPVWNGTTCAGSYCHGATLNGGTAVAPVWTKVDGTQAKCDSCHGMPPGGTHPPGKNCSTCHGQVVDANQKIIAPNLHINGHVEVIALQCNSCHGGAANAAPPVGSSGQTATTDKSVGAHQKHLASSSWHNPVQCTHCHAVPKNSTDPGHTDSPLPAEVVFTALAVAKGAQPVWNGTTCAGSYCHGGTMTGGTATSPVWTKVDGTQSACGSCHGMPPGGSHPANPACSTCHGMVVDANRRIIAPNLHLNGLVEVTTMQCNSCHGGAANAAPPVSTTGETATSARGVGAHQSHLRTSTWRAPLQCADCHVVPTSSAAAGHSDTPLPAEVTFAGLARHGGANPVWNGVTCAGSYCHGGTMNGGTVTAPSWTKVDGTQAACGACHGLPPGGTHPQNSACSSCHGQVVNAARAIIAPNLHLNGQVEVVNLQCNTCHGGATNSAPPKGTNGQTATTDRSVGAHQAHLGSSTWRAPMLCSDCHVVPPAVSSPGHNDSALPAELVFSALSKTQGANPVWNGVTCAGTYCHGATLSAGTITAPTWTKVDGTQAACGTCHGLPPTQNHPANGACSVCHGQVVDAARKIIAPLLHVNGKVESQSSHPAGYKEGNVHGPDYFANPASCATASCHGTSLDGAAGTSCNSCHANWKTNCIFCHGGTDNRTGAPPASVSGQTLKSVPGVGAHTRHLTASATHVAWDCALCHRKPTDAMTAGHVDPSPAELVFGGLAAGSAYNAQSHVCSNVYCHGDGRTNGSATWTGTLSSACAPCHDDETVATERSMSGDHHKHIVDKRIKCWECHATVVNASKQIISATLHVNGRKEVSMPSGTYNASTRLCTTTCHKNQTW
ncbi:MAG: CxxxxCH/CxxCH domain-containing protein [Deltaproteobacteria bacterium]|nr:CxxxxCH/CxxCH domain-containing protein [Deltaproteobacteria bacterium]